ncbi:AhpC/TSA family protein [Chitinibacteraceae bacterium HSL-7]
MPTLITGNLLAHLPDHPVHEVFEDIVHAPGVRIERIVSYGHTTPEHEWYDQSEHEWVMVLEGEAIVQFDDGRRYPLAAGDHLAIPAHQRHRVAWTPPDTLTIWLAVFYADPPISRIFRMQLTPGSPSPRLALQTIQNTPIVLPDPARRLVHLQFRRFAGSPICNLHLRSISQRIADIRSAGILEVVVFHSSQTEMLNYQAELPFDCVADPEMALYRQFGVEARWSASLHPLAMWAGLRGVLTGKRLPTRMENGVNGLPADFLIDADGRVVAAHYGQHADDQWSVDTLLALASPAS